MTGLSYDGNPTEDFGKSIDELKSAVATLNKNLWGSQDDRKDRGLIGEVAENTHFRQNAVKTFTSLMLLFLTLQVGIIAYFLNFIK